MAQALPFITTAVTAGTAALSFIRGKKADKSAKVRSKEAVEARKVTADELGKDEFQQRKELGARRRIMSLREGGQGGTLFGGFGGTASKLGA